MQQMKGSDSLFLYGDKPGQHQHISMIYVYDQSTASEGTVRFKKILEHLQSRLGTSRVFRQRLVSVPLDLDYPYWIEDPDFDIENHVRHIALPAPGDWRQFCIQVSRLHAQPLDMSRPPWEMYVIEGLDNASFLPKGAFAVLTKVHHVAVDGMTGVDITMALHDLEPDPAPVVVHDLWRPEQEPSTVDLLTRSFYNNTEKAVKSGFGLLRKLSGAATKPTALISKLTDNAEDKAPFTRFNRSISSHRVWDARVFPLEDIKAIKQVIPGATVNDVVLTICGGAMARYLESKNELPKQPLISMVPVNVRKESERGQSGNYVYLSRANLRTDIGDPLERLKAVTDEMTKLKAMNAVGAREMTDLQNCLPSTTMALASRTAAASIGPGRKYRESQNMIVTNVPGPQQPLYLCGARLLLFTGMAVITDNLAISHAVTSYDSQMIIAPLSDRKIMPDPGFYAECLEQAFIELKAAVCELKADIGVKGTQES